MTKKIILGVCATSLLLALLWISMFIWSGQALFWSISRNGNPCLGLFLSLGSPVNKSTPRGTPLFFAVSSGDIYAVRLLVKHGANINEDRSAIDKSLVAYASIYIGPQMTAELIKLGGNEKDVVQANAETVHHEGPPILVDPAEETPAPR